MTFKLSERSLGRLEGVDENMVAAKYAIGITKVGLWHSKFRWSSNNGTTASACRQRVHLKL